MSSENSQFSHSRSRRWIRWIPIVVGGIASLLFAVRLTRTLWAFEAHALPAIEEGLRGDRLVNRLVLIVVDGLSVEGTRSMPTLRTLASNGAEYILRTPVPSFSQVGYSALATGADPEVSGVTSNLVQRASLVDSIFRQAHRAGQRTALVGYAFWLSLFDEDVDIASIDWAQKLPDLTHSGEAQEHRIRRLRTQNGYVDADSDWQRDGMAQNLEESPAEERMTTDLERAAEAIRILRVDEPDLLVLHLQGPDHWGHQTGSPTSEEYIRACRFADLAVQMVVGALDLSRDAVLVTADHGFMEATFGSGHGGPERQVIHIPLIARGRGIRAQTGGVGMQVDVAPLVSSLLGLAIPKHSKGNVPENILEASPALLEGLSTRIQESRDRFNRAYAAAMGISSARDGRPLATGGSDLEQEIDLQLAMRHGSDRRASIVLAAFVFGVLAFASLRRGKMAALALGSVGWIAFEVLTACAYVICGGVYSFSSVISPIINLAWLVVSSLLILFAVLRALKRALLSNSPVTSEGIGDIAAVLALGTLARSAFAAAIVGHGTVFPLPDATVWFSSIAAHVQAASVCLAAPLYTWWAAREEMAHGW